MNLKTNKTGKLASFSKSKFKPYQENKITSRKMYLLTNFPIFCFLAKNGINYKVLGLNTNGLKIKQRAQRGIKFMIPIIFCIMAAKTLIFKGVKISNKQVKCTIYDIRFVFQILNK